MRVKNPDLEKKIRGECLDLLMEREPELIGMRDIASRCGVTATTIYNYYPDKDALLEAVKLDCLASMDQAIFDRAGGESDPVKRLRAGMAAFRDWAFGNPRVALLVMNRFKPNLDMDENELQIYYRTQNFALESVTAAFVSAGRRLTKRAREDAALESSLMIASLWGGIEAILLKRLHPEFWDRGVEFTDILIDRLMAGISAKDRK
jgi:AcrR family transcriptional regulator